MAARTSLLADAEEAIHGARYGAPDEQQVSLGVHSLDPQAELRETARAHVPGHPLPLDDARGVRPRRDRPGLAVTGVAVRLGSPAEVMAVHHALKAPRLGHARDLHQSPRVEDAHGHDLAGLRRLAREGEAPEHARRRLEAGFLDVPEQRLRRALWLAHPATPPPRRPPPLHA